MAYIYYIKNKLTNKYYIGQTLRVDIHDRWRQHINNMRSSKGCPILRQAFQKYGLDNFEFKVIIICFDDDRLDYEKYYITKYNSIAPDGYNILPGGIGGAGFKGKKHKPESILRSVEGCRRYREANPDWFERNRKKWEEGMAKVDIGAAVKNSAKWQKAKAEGRIGWGNRENSEEVCNKISKSVNNYYLLNGDKHKEIIQKKLGKLINQYTLNGIFVKQYPSIGEASRQSGASTSSIYRVLNNLAKHAKGFVWKHANDTT